MVRTRSLTIAAALIVSTTQHQGAHASATLPGSSPLVKWVGRTQTVGDAVFFDWEGTSASVTVTGMTWATVSITDNCGGSTALGGGSRWRVDMTPTSQAISGANHRIQTFYSGPQVPTYYLFNNAGGGCDPECSFSGQNVTFTLTRLTESRLSGCGPGGNLSVTSFATDGVFVAPPPPATRHINFIGDSISAGDLNDGSPLHTCANAAWNDDITLTSGAVLCTSFNADCTYNAWGGIQLGSIDPAAPSWGMQQLYPYTFSALGQNAYSNWTFAAFPVDVVVMNLGTNDHPVPPATHWIAQYVGFVTRLVTQYYANPSLAVFVGFGPMTTEYQPFVEVVVSTLRAANINANTLNLTLPHAMTGCFGHPSAADNVEIAASVQSYIASVMGW